MGYFDGVIAGLNLHVYLLQAPGDCFCKESVYGANCDKCLPTYYNLSASNSQGCQGERCYSFTFVL